MVYAIISLVLSCVSLFAYWWLCIFGVLFGIFGLVTCVDDKTQKGLSISGIIVGGLAFMTMVFIFIFRI